MVGHSNISENSVVSHLFKIREVLYAHILGMIYRMNFGQSLDVLSSDLHRSLGPDEHAFGEKPIHDNFTPKGDNSEKSLFFSDGRIISSFREVQ